MNRSPEFSAPLDEELSRRAFLKYAGASAALASLAGCTREPIHPIVPYVTQPEQLVPGKPLHYATAMSLDGFARGIIVESHEGHPTKIEGNPSHPASLGATGIFEQAALYDLYDPDRARTVTQGGRISNYALFFAAMEPVLATQREKRGAGLRVLSHSITSPTLVAQMEELLRQYPLARWHQYQSIARDNTLEGARVVFGRPLETRLHLDRAKVIVLLDADCFSFHPDGLAYTRQVAQNRREGGARGSVRIYAAEPTPTLAGSVADHRVAASNGAVAKIAFDLARNLGLQAATVSGAFSEIQSRWLAAVTDELKQNSGAGLVVVGESQPPEVHAIVHLINAKLGNTGHTLAYAASPETHWINHSESLAQLAQDLENGTVECLAIFGGNPVFDAPADIPLGHLVQRAKLRVHLSGEWNETAAVCDWHLPESHFLESWGDARSFDGTTSIIQPLIMPLYESKTASELLHVLTHREWWSDYDIVRDYWRTQKPEMDFETWWRQSLHDGLIRGSAFAAVSVEPSAEAPIPSPINFGQSTEICFRPDPSVWDGRFANNGWLQELPKPFSKVTWDNPVLISSGLARTTKLENGDEVEMQLGNRKLKAPVWILPGQEANTVTVHLGLGHTHGGHIGQGVGTNGYALRTSGALWAESGLKLVKTGNRIDLASTQLTHQVEGRDILHSEKPRPDQSDTLYGPAPLQSENYAWGMVIDLNACIGCNACTLACQAENNIPVVGKEQVAAGRDMAWIRVDQYFEGDPDQPQFHHQPVPCMHCENAPCELVCPVGATLHDHEGLNLQVYNRCVGTRYCSNNCPYKVRRFNFFRYADYDTPSFKPMRNPNVTVRWRGVMEKCTYCIQRISAARITSELENRNIRDGEIQTACQQACPAQAITFGNIADSASAVSRLKALPLNFSMLGELNTRPRTTYLTRKRNSNPQLEAAT
jgi:Fe-S-cluster-containing dehydrogenase component/anaerobic selenocysteine-containing dehydrogenase